MLVVHLHSYSQVWALGERITLTFSLHPDNCLHSCTAHCLLIVIWMRGDVGYVQPVLWFVGWLVLSTTKEPRNWLDFEKKIIFIVFIKHYFYFLGKCSRNYGQTQISSELQQSIQSLWHNPLSHGQWITVQTGSCCKFLFDGAKLSTTLLGSCIINWCRFLETCLLGIRY